jgi:hypothetical protein
MSHSSNRSGLLDGEIGISIALHTSSAQMPLTQSIHREPTLGFQLREHFEDTEDVE